MAPVIYIPSQTVDESGFTSNRTSVSSPWVLFFHDAAILFKNLKFILSVILPIRIPAHRHGVRFYLVPIVANETLLALSIMYEAMLLLAGCLAIFVLPGGAFVMVFVFTTGIVVLLAAPGWGSRTVQSRNVRIPSNNFPNEKWVFINGVAQSHMDLQFTVDNLAATFKRPFLGIHNRSLGFVWDIGESLIQRCFGYSSEDVRICYDELKMPLLNPSITKVVIIAHSQGALILSLTIDRMFAELPFAAMSKLEIYTFGSAAAHFNNPLKFCSHIDRNLRMRDSLDDQNHHQATHEGSGEQLSVISQPSLRDYTYDGTQKDSVHCRPHSRTIGRTNEGNEHIIPVIEHYCNEFDLVPRWGVLDNVRSQPQYRYAGCVFVHRQTSGHLFNRHYLDTMFPMDRHAQDFLNQVVDVDIHTAKARVCALASSATTVAEIEPEALAWLLYHSITKLVSPSSFLTRLLAAILYARPSLTEVSCFENPSLGQVTKIVEENADLIAKENGGMDLDCPGHEYCLGEKVKTLAETAEKVEAAAAVEQCRGKTVRQLSKLWRYMYGGVA